MVYDEVGAWSGKAYPPGAVVVGYNGKKHCRAALAWGSQEATRRDAPLLVLFAANYPVNPAGQAAQPAEAPDRQAGQVQFATSGMSAPCSRVHVRAASRASIISCRSPAARAPSDGTRSMTSMTRW